MRLNCEFTMMDMGGEIAAVPVGDGAGKFHGMLKLNAEAAEILELLKEETTPMQLHNALKAKHPETTDEEIGHILVPFINQLIREGLLHAP